MDQATITLEVTLEELACLDASLAHECKALAESNPPAPAGRGRTAYALYKKVHALTVSLIIDPSGIQK